MIRKSSGEKLFIWMLNRYSKHQSENTWIDTISREFNILDLKMYLLRSTIFMLVRRLIYNANWYVNQYPGELSTIIEIYERNYLLGMFGFEKPERKILSKLIFDSLAASKEKISKPLRNKILREAVSRNQLCKLCGEEIDYYLNSNQPDSYSLDHIWPKSMGGESKDWNLQISHKRCNENRKDYIEASDVHYEHFHIKTDWDPNKEASFWKEFKWEYRFAAFLNGGFKCQVCKNPDPLKEIGSDLQFSTLNRDENFNMFNIQITCGKHRKLPGVSV